MLIKVFKRVILNLLIFLLCSPILKITYSSNPISEESCLWTPTLNYTYNGKDVDMDTWHQNRKPFLSEAYKILNGPNIAVANLSVIYKNYRGEHYNLRSFDIPYYFISGWDEKRLGYQSERKKTLLKSLGAKYAETLETSYTNPIFIKSITSRINSRVNYANHLISIYCNNNPITQEVELSALQRIRQKPQELQYFLEGLQNPALTSENSRLIGDFNSRFYDSEQAIFLWLQEYLKPPKLSFSDLIKDIPYKSSIHYFVLNIASYFDMCFDCGDTGFRQTEASRSFNYSLRSAFSEARADYQVLSECSTFIEISSNRPTYWPDEINPTWSSRGENTNYNDTYNQDCEFLKTKELLSNTRLPSEKFSAYVAQRFLQ